jgi:protein-S-isoprenylcysteine O-methyltransferase Ste14
MAKAGKAKLIGLKAMLGWLNLAVFLGLLIFLPAWTFQYWQGWAYLASFLLPTLAITAYFLKRDAPLIQRRLKAGPVAEKRISQKVIQSFANLAFVGIYLLSALDHRFRWANCAAGLSVLADFIVVLGFYIVFLAFRENSFASALIEVGKGQKIVSSGPYAVVRHPMYSGALLMILVTPLALDSLAGLICAVLLGVVIVFRLRDEEGYLSKNLAGYLKYRRKVRFRLIPFIW